LNQDFQNLNSYAQSLFPGTATRATTPQQRAANNAQLGPFAGILGPLDSIDPTSPNYDPNALGKLFKWLLIGAGVFLAIELAPTINNLTAQRRHE
jgi:hypothetical protein